MKILRVVKVGSAERPAGQEDINAVQEKMAQAKNDPNVTFVTHHAMEMEEVEIPTNYRVVVKVGSDERPAGPDDIKDIEAGVKQAINGDLIFVTHHAVEFSVLSETFFKGYNR